MESLKYEISGNSPLQPRVTVYALSTCGFCKRGLAWLDAHSFPYRYVYLDSLPIETKNSVKAELTEKFGKPVSFPYVVVDDTSVLVGFVESDWEGILAAK